MKYFYLAFFLITLNITILPQNINGRFSSSVYVFERFDTAEVSNIHARAYQLLSLNINKDKFSLRSYLNVENEFSEKFSADTTRVRFYNLYLEARDLFELATIKIGRQPQFNSVAGGIFDGANLELKKDKYKLSGFYGFNVPAYQKLELTDQQEDDYIAGGRFTTVAIPNFRIVLSYIHKNFRKQDYSTSRLDDDLNPIEVEIRNKSNKYRFGSAQVSYQMQKVLYIDTRYDYDFNFEKTSKFEINGRYEQIENFGLNVYYNYRAPKIRYNSIFSVFDYGNTQEIEVGGDYKLNKEFTVIGKFGNVTYESENSQRITAGLNTNWGSFNYRKTFGYAGELDAVSLYSAYSLYEGLLTPSLGVSYTSYKLSEDSEKNNLTTLLAGLNFRPFRVLSFDVQGQYMNNKIYKDDYRFFFKLNYWFNENLF
jgi:hypothetical protein